MTQSPGQPPVPWGDSCSQICGVTLTHPLMHSGLGVTLTVPGAQGWPWCPTQGRWDTANTTLGHHLTEPGLVPHRSAECPDARLGHNSGVCFTVPGFGFLPFPLSFFNAAVTALCRKYAIAPPESPQSQPCGEVGSIGLSSECSVGITGKTRGSKFKHDELDIEPGFSDSTSGLKKLSHLHQLPSFSAKTCPPCTSLSTQ